MSCPKKKAAGTSSVITTDNYKFRVQAKAAEALNSVVECRVEDGQQDGRQKGVVSKNAFFWDYLGRPTEALLHTSRYLWHVTGNRQTHVDTCFKQLAFLSLCLTLFEV